MHRYDPIHDTYKDDPPSSSSSGTATTNSGTTTSSVSNEVAQLPAIKPITVSGISTSSLLNPIEPPSTYSVPAHSQLRSLLQPEEPAHAPIKKSTIASLIDPVSPPEVSPNENKDNYKPTEEDEATETENEEDLKIAPTPTTSIPTAPQHSDISLQPISNGKTTPKTPKKPRKQSKKAASATGTTATDGSTPGKPTTVLISARSRHLKKEDGHPFTRKDIQYAFLRALFDDKTKTFHDPYPDLKERVKLYNDTEEDKKFDYLETENQYQEQRPAELLTFAQLYIKTIAHSSKCSKILRDRLINDYKTSIPTCMICVLVNVGRMNTTINFVPDMKSQLRTYHSIPVLQVNYEKTGNVGPRGTSSSSNSDKQLQDTPRLKSILKACCDDTKEPNYLSQLASVETLPKTNVVNLMFLLCNSEDDLLEGILGCSFFDLFANTNYEPKQRAKLLLWLMYNYLETDLSEEQIAKNPFGPKPELVTEFEDNYDVDTEEEKTFGQIMLDERKLYLNDEDFYKETKIQSREKKRRQIEEANPSAPDGESTPEESKPPTKTNKRAKLAPKEPSTSKPPASKESKSSHSKPEKSKTTPTRATSSTSASASSSTTNPKATKPEASEPSEYVPPPPPPPPVYRTDINVRRVRKVLNELQKNNHKRRLSQGMIRFTNRLLTTPYKEIRDGRLRLKSYQGDYVEYSGKMHRLFKKLAEDKSKEGEEDVRCNVGFKLNSKGDDLSLESFDIGI
ncbi:hypothetical protein WICPIJ_003890 [Wickerhamomyces pijperi]|uniref:Ino eighty subunit 1 n=1 Tax=Wickerhamomyces pijperi TaxID=599730 RepID=A0A9P8Q6P7_WICPI|nr:hypothetical protein WICPIJ_003890 [Wickerhamomyces pijperi]